LRLAAVCRGAQVPGVVLYGWAKREQRTRLFKPFETAILAALVVLAAIAAWLLSSGKLGL
jgi:arginine:ornithine antiporter/lysine permease